MRKLVLMLLINIFAFGAWATDYRKIIEDDIPNSEIHLIKVEQYLNSAAYVLAEVYGPNNYNTTVIYHILNDGSITAKNRLDVGTGYDTHNSIEEGSPRWGGFDRISGNNIVIAGIVTINQKQNIKVVKLDNAFNHVATNYFELPTNAGEFSNFTLKTVNTNKNLGQTFGENVCIVGEVTNFRGFVFPYLLYIDAFDFSDPTLMQELQTVVFDSHAWCSEAGCVGIEAFVTASTSFDNNLFVGVLGSGVTMSGSEVWKVDLNQNPVKIVKKNRYIFNYIISIKNIGPDNLGNDNIGVLAIDGSFSDGKDPNTGEYFNPGSVDYSSTNFPLKNFMKTNYTGLYTFDINLERTARYIYKDFLGSDFEFDDNRQRIFVVGSKIKASNIESDFCLLTHKSVGNFSVDAIDLSMNLNNKIKNQIDIPNHKMYHVENSSSGDFLGVFSSSSINSEVDIDNIRVGYNQDEFEICNKINISIPQPAVDFTISPDLPYTKSENLLSSIKTTGTSVETPYSNLEDNCCELTLLLTNFNVCQGSQGPFLVLLGLDSPVLDNDFISVYDPNDLWNPVYTIIGEHLVSNAVEVPGIGTWLIRYWRNGCLGEAYVTIGTYPVPNYVVPSPIEVCKNDLNPAIQLYNPTLTESWNTTHIVSGFLNVSSLPCNLLQYTDYTVTDQYNCNYTSQVSLLKNCVEFPTASDLGFKCENENVINLDSEISPFNGTSSWTGTGVIQPNMFDPVAAGVGVHYLTLTLTQNGCTESKPISVEVRALLNASFTPGSGLICNNQTQTFTANTAGGTWTCINKSASPEVEVPLTINGLNAVFNPNNKYALNSQSIEVCHRQFNGQWAGEMICNGSFDNTTGCPNYPGEIEKANCWEDVNDYSCYQVSLMHSCNTSAGPPSAYTHPCDVAQGINSANGYTNIPLGLNNYYGNATNHGSNSTTGGYASVIAYYGQGHVHNGSPSDQGYREYMKQVLSTPLVAGTYYKIEFYVQLAEASRLGSSIHAVLLDQNPNTLTTPTQFGTSTWNDHQISPIVSYQASAGPVEPILTTHVISDKNNWVKVEQVFKANGGEKWLVIGNFNLYQGSSYKSFADRTVDLGANSGNGYPIHFTAPSGNTHYMSMIFIDDVSIKSMESCVTEECKIYGIVSCPEAPPEDDGNGNSNVASGNFDFTAYPNPTSDNLSVKVASENITSDVLNARLYNGTGVTLLERKLNLELETEFEFDLSGLKSGMYILEIECNGLVKQKRISVIK